MIFGSQVTIVNLMNKKYPWLPVDERLIPDIWSWKYPKNVWVRLALAIEMTCAVLAVVGTLILALLPQTYSTTPKNSNATESATYSK